MRLEEMLPPTAHRPELSCPFEELSAVATFNLVDWIVDRHVRAGNGNHTALIHYPDGAGAPLHCTYAGLHEQYRRIASGLIRHGIGRSDRVAIVVREHPDTVALTLAAFAIGALPIPLSTMCRTREIEWCIDDLSPSLIVVDETLLAEVRPLRDGAHHRVVWSPQRAPVDGYTHFSTLVQAEPIESPVTIGSEDEAIIFHSAGTTARPKPCIHSHRSLLAMGLANNRFNFCTTPGTKLVASAFGPASHAYAWVCKVLYPLLAGGTGVLMEKVGGETLQRILRDGVLTHLAGSAPTFKRFLLDAPPLGVDLRSIGLQRVFSGMHTDASNGRLQQLVGLQPGNVYGSAPLGGIVTHVGAGEPFGSCGKPLPGYEASIVALDCDHPFTEDGRIIELPAGEVGRLAMKGLSGTTYLNRNSNAAAEVQHGWTLTDDVFAKDLDGYLWFHGRISGVIKTSGFSVAPGEVEKILLEHPLVDRAAIVGVPDSDRGEIIKAYVQLVKGCLPSDAVVEELQNHVKRNLSPYKYPRLFEFMDIPMTETGKVPYALLREREQECARQHRAASTQGTQ